MNEWITRRTNKLLTFTVSCFTNGGNNAKKKILPTISRYVQALVWKCIATNLVVHVYFPDGFSNPVYLGNKTFCVEIGFTEKSM
jgi:hypothetical protein